MAMTEKLRNIWTKNKRGETVLNAKVAFEDAWNMVTPTGRQFLIVVVVALLVILAIHWSV